MALPKVTAAPAYVPDKEVPWFVNKIHGIFNINRSSYRWPDLPGEFFDNFSGPGHEAEHDKCADDASSPFDHDAQETDADHSEDEFDGFVDEFQNHAL